MLKFTKPFRFDMCLRETYGYLVPVLVNAMGYPPCVQSFPLKMRPKGASARQEDGTLLIGLPGRKGEPSDKYLCLPPLAAKDEFCRQLAGRFVTVYTGSDQAKLLE